MATTKKSGFYHVSTTRKTKCECVNREKLTTYRYQYCDAISLKIYTKNNSHILLLFVIRGRCYRHGHSRQFATLQFWFHTQISMMNVKYSDLNKFDYTKIWGTSQQQHQSSIFAVLFNHVFMHVFRLIYGTLGRRGCFVFAFSCIHFWKTVQFHSPK